MSARNRLLSLIAVICLVAGGILIIAAVVAAGAMNSTPAFPPDTPGPLPNDCQDVTGLGVDPPVCCAFGYVYYDAMPVTGAQVTIQSASGVFTTTTSIDHASINLLLCWRFCQILGGRRKGSSDPNGDAWLTTRDATKAPTPTSGRPFGGQPRQKPGRAQHRLHRAADHPARHRRGAAEYAGPQFADRLRDPVPVGRRIHGRGDAPGATDSRRVLRPMRLRCQRDATSMSQPGSYNEACALASPSPT